MANPRAQRRLREFVRRFRENGIKLLLEHPANVRDLLHLHSSPLVQMLDFAGLEFVKTTFIRRDFRHVESDVVLAAPLLDSARRPSGKKLLIYVLIEHQSEPDRLLPLRLTDYQVQIFRFQERQWARTHRSFAGLRLQPVLPVVFYTFPTSTQWYIMNERFESRRRCTRLSSVPFKRTSIVRRFTVWGRPSPRR